MSDSGERIQIQAGRDSSASSNLREGTRRRKNIWRSTWSSIQPPARRSFRIPIGRRSNHSYRSGGDAFSLSEVFLLTRCYGLCR